MQLTEASVSGVLPRVIWQPLPGSQTLAMSCPAHVILYHGTRGPGKTDAQLMRFRARVGQGYKRHWRGIIFDREYKNLDDLIAKSMRWFPEFKDGARFLSSKSDYRWVWPTGEELLFRSVKRDKDYWAYHGQEFPFIGWNELSKYASSNLFDMLMSCNRSSFIPEENLIIDNDTGEVWTPPEIPLEVFATTNPFGPGHNWLKKRFINAGRAGQIVRKTVKVFDPKTKEEIDYTVTQTHLFGSYKENRYLSAKYIAELVMMSDKNKRAAWLNGSWDIVSGGMFDDVWDKAYNVVKAFQIPRTWRIVRTFDWGSSKPFSTGWWATSDGSDIRLPDGRVRSTVRGDTFRIREWYGTTGKPNQGLQMLASEVAAGIIEREIMWGIYGLVVPGPADSQIYEVQNGNSIAADMQKPQRVNGLIMPGITWIPADKSSGSRINGWEICRKLVKNATPLQLPNGTVCQREKPGMFVFEEYCPYFIDLFPTLPRDEEKYDDVDTEAEDHIGDETRYHILHLGYGASLGTTTGT
jgi:hypothetical protein